MEWTTKLADGWTRDNHHKREYRYTHLDGGRASMTEERDGKHWVHQVNPYDLTEYHWAYSTNGVEWLICITGRNGNREVDRIHGTADDALAAARQADTAANLTPCMDHS